MKKHIFAIVAIAGILALMSVVISGQVEAKKQTTQLKEEYGLVWCGDKRLEEFYTNRHPRTCSIRTSGVSRGERFAAGRKDGKSITIRRPITKSTNRGRTLPPA